MGTSLARFHMTKYNMILKFLKVQQQLIFKYLTLVLKGLLLEYIKT